MNIFIKCISFLLVVYVLQSCSDNKNEFPLSDNGVDSQSTPQIKDGDITPSSTKSASINMNISSGNTATGVVYSTGLQNIIKLQLEKGPDAILDIDCSLYAGESKIYCNEQKKEIETHKKEITWEATLKNGSEYIKTFDCDAIASPYGQKYCKEYQNELKK